jgi:hypothetical protein
MQKKEAAEAASLRLHVAAELENDDVRGLQALGTLGHVERDFRAFLKAAESVALDRAEMHEDVIAGAAGDESETLRIVEPLDNTIASAHLNLLFLSRVACSEIQQS